MVSSVPIRDSNLVRGTVAFESYGLDYKHRNFMLLWVGLLRNDVVSGSTGSVYTVFAFVRSFWYGVFPGWISTEKAINEDVNDYFDGVAVLIVVVWRICGARDGRD